VVAEALSRRYTLLFVLEAKFLGFQTIQELHNENADFQEVLQGELKGGLIPSKEGTCSKETSCVFPGAMEGATSL